MQIAILELEIFSGLVVLLGAIFVALVCDFLKGNNEQLRERNVELRTRQEERERLGVFQNPSKWIQALASALRPAGAGEVPSEKPEPASPEADAFTPLRRTSEPARKTASAPALPSSWANQEELEQFAEREASLRSRHEAHKSNEDRLKVETEASFEEARAAESPSAEPPAVQPVTVAPVTVAPVTVAQDAPPIPDAAPQPPPAERPAAQVPGPGELERPRPLTKPGRPRPVVKMVGSSAMLPVLPVDVATAVPQALLKFDKKPGFRSSASLPALTTFEPPLPASRTAPASAESEPASKLLAPNPATEPHPEIDLTADIQRVTDLAITQAREAFEEEAAREIAPSAASSSSDLTVEIAAYHFDNAATLEMPALTFQEPETADALPALAEAVLQASLDGPRSLEIPTGLHEASALDPLIQAGVPFSGVAVVIGINDAAALHEKLAANSTDSTGALNRMIQSMLRPEDFACQSSEEEFVLLYPAESGPSAQRRLFQVSEKLWDFQLRSLGHLSVMFSWGGLEVQNEKLGNAVESARERMQQTRRNRKSSPLEAAGGRRLVANG
jgi:hypothetical protein